MATGPFGTTIEPPPNVASPTTYEPNDLGNRGSYASVISFQFWKHLMGTVMNQANHDLTNLPQ